MMHKGWLIKYVQSAVVLTILLLSGEATAFTFQQTSGGVRIYQTDEDLSGEVWAYAVTDSWKETRNTVWSHCKEVFESYGTESDFNVNKCEEDVAALNGMTRKKLGSLREGDEILLPMPRIMAQEYLASDPEEETLQPSGGQEVTTRVSDLVQKQSELEQEITAQYESLAALRKTFEEQDQYIDELISRIEFLEGRIEAQKKIIEERAVPADASVLSLTSPRVQPSWVWQIILGVYAILAAGLLIVLALWLRSHQQYVASARQIRVLEGRLRLTELDFGRQHYPFDGKEYWIELLSVNKEGRVYRTPFAEEVKEHNLRSHFAHATKKAMLKEAAE